MLKNYCLLKDFTDTLYVNIDNIFWVFTPLSATSTSILRVEQNMAPTDSLILTGMSLYVLSKFRENSVKDVILQDKTY